MVNIAIGILLHKNLYTYNLLNFHSFIIKYDNYTLVLIHIFILTYVTS
jgi:hypothetical protein